MAEEKEAVGQMNAVVASTNDFQLLLDRVEEARAPPR